MSRLPTIGPAWDDGRVRAVCTLRTGGASAVPFDSLNLGSHVGDAPAAVAENRARLRRELGLQSEPRWLSQVHGTRVLVLDEASADAEGAGALARENACATGPASASAEVVPQADAAVTRLAGVACVILVADCIPVLFASHDGEVIGAAHAGWRGLAGGVLENTVSEMTRLGAEPARLSAWLGPGIGPAHFEVGGEVRDAFLVGDAGASGAFVPNARGKWQCDLASLARRRLMRLGLSDISGGEFCTYADRERFYSYRRDGRCGRMATLIWRA